MLQSKGDSSAARAMAIEVSAVRARSWMSARAKFAVSGVVMRSLSEFEPARRISRTCSLFK